MMSILVSLSDLFGPDAQVIQLESGKEKSKPVYVAVLYSLIFPIVATAFTMVVKYINKTLKLNTNDWLQMYNLIWSTICTVLCIVHFVKNSETFSWKFLLEGMISGICTTIGATFATLALQVENAPQGPTTAVMNTRIMMLVIIDCFVSRSLPSILQWIGLLFGILGTLIVSIPD